MSAIKWEKIERGMHDTYSTGVISFLMAPNPMGGCIGGTLETDYAKIDYSTIGGHSDYNGPAWLIEDYGEWTADESGADHYYDYDDIMKEDPDLRLVDICERIGGDQRDYFDEQFNLDGLELFVTLKDSEGELTEQSYWWYNGGLTYPIDLESLTVGNWNHKVEAGFKAAAEDFLNSLRDAKTLEEIYKKCEEHFYEVEEIEPW